MPTHQPCQLQATSKLSRLACVVVTLLAATSFSAAQCTPEWLPGDGIPGVDGPVYAMVTWDPDGPGPLDAQLVIGGNFTMAGREDALNIARWSGSSWLALGVGMNDIVRALAVLPSGELIAGGDFTRAGGVDAAHIACWNGAKWSSLGLGTSGSVYAVAALADGFIAAGAFSAAGGTNANHIARWTSGTPGAWSSLGLGVNNIVYALTALPNGDVVAGGRFSLAGGLSANRVAMWNGTMWNPLGIGVDGPNPHVYALAALSNGDVIVGGRFATAGGLSTNNVARCSPSGVWTALGSGIGSSEYSYVFALKTLPGGDMVAGGAGFTEANTDNLVRWTGSSWITVGEGLNEKVSAIAGNASDLFIGGGFTKVGNTGVGRVARLRVSNPEPWSALGIGFNDTVRALVALPDGGLVAGGTFTTAGPATANLVGRWSGSAWEPLGTGLATAVPWLGVEALAVLPNGDILASGMSIGLARWNGTAWEPFEAQLGTVNAFVKFSDGSVVAGGNFTTIGGVNLNRVARWSGTAWEPFGAGVNGNVRALALLPNGDLVAAGEFTTAGGLPANRIARWNGLNWAPFGSGLSGPNGPLPPMVSALAVLPSGDLVAGGTFTLAGGMPANYVARWQAKTETWAPLGAGIPGLRPWVQALAVLPRGDLVSGWLIQNSDDHEVPIKSWNSAHSSWSNLGLGVGAAHLYPGVFALAALSNGDLAVGGYFKTAGGQPSAYFARWGCSCYANCDSSTGSPLLTANDFQCYLNQFASNSAYANCDNSTGSPALTPNDFQCFLNRYAAGCP